jgi:hypothetical protein
VRAYKLMSLPWARNEAAEALAAKNNGKPEPKEPVATAAGDEEPKPGP